jgi:hypothetical protein
MAAVQQNRDELAALGQAARRRVLAEHTADVRAEELEGLLEQAMGGAARLTRSTSVAHSPAPQVCVVRHESHVRHPPSSFFQSDLSRCAVHVQHLFAACNVPGGHPSPLPSPVYA